MPCDQPVQDARHTESQRVKVARRIKHAAQKCQQSENQKGKRERTAETPSEARPVDPQEVFAAKGPLTPALSPSEGKRVASGRVRGISCIVPLSVTNADVNDGGGYHQGHCIAGLVKQAQRGEHPAAGI
jgi:hypothetical protein